MNTANITFGPIKRVTRDIYSKSHDHDSDFVIKSNSGMRALSSGMDFNDDESNHDRNENVSHQNDIVE